MEAVNTVVSVCVCLDFFYAMDFGGSEHSEKKVYEVYILFGLSWTLYPSEQELIIVSVLVLVSPIFSAFL